ncbi:hypothetical protein GCM10011519_18410 [Marmoricola endophyticus]|uniref:Uncharacterized protein n=1 Tax=Marmoricola endophyticus TaxID=2040280 RepID=A0A917BGZ8_9ACTN|nr:hypothetical protein [Marmoricola endophyticus]GGF44900.1 hypothetical protein GCM10011519_18410 [Marmoricola endophyticus]
MTERDEVEVWPLWGRILFLTVVALVLVAALVAAIGGGFRLTWGAVRIYVAAAILPGLLVLGVVEVLRRHSLHLSSQLGEALSALAQETAGEAQLRGVSTGAARARDQLDRGDYRAALATITNLEEQAERTGDPALASRAESLGRDASRLRRSLAAMERQGR